MQQKKHKTISEVTRDEPEKQEEEKDSPEPTVDDIRKIEADLAELKQKLARYGIRI